MKKRSIQLTGNDREKWKLPNRIAEYINSIGISICIAFLAMLALSSLLVTYSERWGYRLSETLEKTTFLNAPLMVAETMICVVLCVPSLYVVSKLCSKLSERQILFCTCVFTTLFQCWWIWSQKCDATWYSDARQMLRYGRELAADSYVSFNESIQGLHILDMKEGTRYLLEYPYQSGILVYFYGMFKFFGHRAPYAIQLINVCANTGSIIMISWTGFLAFQEGCIRKLIPILLGFCLPSLLYATFMYGNQLGFFFATVFLLLNAKALKMTQGLGKVSVILLSLIPMTLMMWIKSTFILFILAIVLIWFLNALRECTKFATLCFVTAFFVLIAANILGNVPVNYMESKLGYDFGKGMPKTAWIAIGLENESVLGKTMPGWWNGGAIENQDETNNDYDQQVKLSIESIGREINKMVTHPKYGIWFISEKIGTEWLTPDFQSFYFAGVNYKMTDPGIEGGVQFNLCERDISIPDENASRIERTIDQIDSLRGFMDGYQSFIYIFAFWGCLKILKKHRDNKNEERMDYNMLLLPCAFIVGAAVYILWEAKAQYALPFFMMLPAIAAYGFADFSTNVMKHKISW